MTEVAPSSVKAGDVVSSPPSTGRWESEGGASHPKSVKEEESKVAGDPELKQVAQKGFQSEEHNQTTNPSNSATGIEGGAAVDTSSSSTSVTDSGAGSSNVSPPTGEGVPAPLGRRLSWSERAKATWEQTKEKAASIFSKEHQHPTDQEHVKESNNASNKEPKDALDKLTH